ncbi:MAG TPA: glycosyl hydrolase, partial [Longimicrobiaceae bacterium]
GEANWTPRLLEEFRERRGYDLRDRLPALLGPDSGEVAARVLTDYRQTISELLLERFTAEWRDWAEDHDALVRNQAHGSPANILDLYAASDIPETEGTEIQRIKFASSAAHIAGKPLTAAEAATWLNEHFTSTLADVREAVDRYLLGGVNHVVYHGTAYSPRGDPWPGWLFYAAVQFNPQNPWWEDFGALNRYVGRAQAFLQEGEPDEDLLFYFPISDWYAQRTGSALLQHFNGMPGGPVAQGHAFVEGADELHRLGYAYDFVSDAQVVALGESEGTLRAPGASYRAILVPEAHSIPWRTFERLVELAREGATVAFYRGLPRDVAGLAELEERRARFRAQIDALRFEPVSDTGVRQAAVGDGRILVGGELAELLAHAGVRREALTDRGLEFIRRRHDDGTTYFIANWSEEALDGWVPLEVSAAAAALYDPMMERSGYARVRPAQDGRSEVYLQMEPGETRIVRTYDAPRTGAAWPYAQPAGAAFALEGEWELRFVEGGPELPAPVRTRRLGSWTELEGEAVKRFSGSATYSLSFPRPAGVADAWILDLGAVHQSARVTLNGESLGTLLGPVYRVRVPASLLRAENRIEVTVTNLMGNRIADLDRRKVFWKKFYNVNFPSRLRENRGPNGLFDASGWAPQPSGLGGPVTLIPVEES